MIMNLKRRQTILEKKEDRGERRKRMQTNCLEIT